MTSQQIEKLSEDWKFARLGTEAGNDLRAEIIRKLSTGTPQRQAYNIALFTHYLQDHISLGMFIRILQSEAERSEV